MKRLLNFFAEHPWWVLTALLLVSVAAATQLGKVELRISADELLVRDDPERAYFQEIREQFGDDEVALLVLSDDDVMAPAKLEQLRDVLDQLESLPCVSRVESLFSIPHLRSVDGYLKTDPYIDDLPETRAEAQAILEAALESPFVRNVLLSADGDVMAVGIVLDEEMQIDEFNVTRSIDGITRGLEDVYDDVFVIGFPHVRIEIADKLAEEQGQLFPLAVAALLIALFILLRQVLDILIPVLTSGLSILWTLGLMGATGIPLNVVTSIVPILLVIVGSTEDIHLLSEFRRGQRMGLDTGKAVNHMVKKMGRTVLLTFVTTYAGFLSIGLSGIEVLWQFGIVASTGLLLNFVITVSLIPALLRLAGHWRLGSRRPSTDDIGCRWADRYWRFLYKRRWWVVLVVTVVTVVAAAGMRHINLNHNAVDNLATDSRLRAQVQKVNDELAGMESFSVVLESGIEDTFLKVRYLEELAEIQAFIDERGFARATTSFADYLALMNGVFQELGGPELPTNDDEIYELMIFLDHGHVKEYVSETYDRARILVRHNISAAGELQAFVNDLEVFLDEHLDAGLSARITGDSVLTLSATSSLISGQLQSIGVLLLFVALIISLLFTDWRVGLMAVLPNAFPVVVLFGFMGYSGIPLNIGTAMAAAIAIGLAVDDTMHFMLRYNQELRSSKSQLNAMRLTIRGETLPVVSTSVALMAGFLVFSLSDFEPVAQFGILSALVIGTALVADFVITPLVMSSLRLVTLWDLLSPRMRQQVIPKSPLFRGMRPLQIRRFILSSGVQHYATGDFIFRRGDESNELYLVMTGAVEVCVTEDGEGCGRVVVGEFGSGELFGDVALLAQEPRQTDAVALANTTLLVLTREAIHSTYLLHPYLATRLFRNLSVDISRRWVRMVAQTKKTRETGAKKPEEMMDDKEKLVLPPKGND